MSIEWYRVDTYTYVYADYQDNKRYYVCHELNNRWTYSRYRIKPFTRYKLEEFNTQAEAQAAAEQEIIRRKSK
jgi:hypothetical protein